MKDFRIFLYWFLILQAKSDMAQISKREGITPTRTTTTTTICKGRLSGGRQKVRSEPLGMT